MRNDRCQRPWGDEGMHSKDASGLGVRKGCILRSRILCIVSAARAAAAAIWEG